MPARPLPIANIIKLAADAAAGPRVAAVAADEVATVVAAIQAVVSEPPDTAEKLVASAATLEAETEPLARLSAAIGFWSPPPTANIWERLWPALLAKHASANVDGLTSALAAYPACIVAYAFGVGAVAADRQKRVASLLTSLVPAEHRAWRPLIEEVTPYLIGDQAAVHLPGAANRIWPFSDHMHSVLRSWFTDLVPDDEDFARQFDRFETLSALARYWLSGPQRADAWVYLGRLRRYGRYMEDATVSLLAEPGREPSAAALLRTLGCPDEEISVHLDGFHAAANKVMAQVIF